jgi:hypothetical protein
MSFLGEIRFFDIISGAKYVLSSNSTTSTYSPSTITDYP